MDRVEVERHQATAVVARRAVYRDVVELGQPVVGVLGEEFLVGLDVLHADVVEVVDGGVQRHALCDGRRSGLELPREVLPRRVLVGDRPDHVAAVEVRLHRLEEVLFPVERADARRAAHLVAGERVEVAAHRLHVDGQVRHRLRAVDEDVRAVVVREVRERRRPG